MGDVVVEVMELDASRRGPEPHTTA